MRICIVEVLRLTTGWTTWGHILEILCSLGNLIIWLFYIYILLLFYVSRYVYQTKKGCPFFIEKKLRAVQVYLKNVHGISSNRKLIFFRKFPIRRNPKIQKFYQKSYPFREDLFCCCIFWGSKTIFLKNKFPIRRKIKLKSFLLGDFRPKFSISRISFFKPPKYPENTISNVELHIILKRRNCRSLEFFQLLMKHWKSEIENFLCTMLIETFD